MELPYEVDYPQRSDVVEGGKRCAPLQQGAAGGVNHGAAFKEASAIGEAMASGIDHETAASSDVVEHPAGRLDVVGQG